MRPRTYNLQAGLLMTILVGAAFVIHRDQEALYLAGGSPDAVQHEGRGGETSSSSSSSAASNSPAARMASGLNGNVGPHLPQ
jgi:hypothetical protein